ncbi:cupin domain-containing protein [Komagataeibacter rhaeticus]|nr:cupin domain-containing protein [Komagataeibacter rhaeticus]
MRVVDSRNFPVASTIAAAINVVEPGRMRELHWHPNNDEWQYFVRGRARMTVFASGGRRARLITARGCRVCAAWHGPLP